MDCSSDEPKSLEARVGIEHLKALKTRKLLYFGRASRTKKQKSKILC